MTDKMPQSNKRIGYWLSEKKSRKLSLSDIEESLRARNIEAVKIDLTKDLNLQGPFNLLLHKLTDIIVESETGNQDAQALLENFEQYVRDNPNVVVIDPVDCLRTLIDRFRTYTIIQNCDFVKNDETVFVPPFVTLESNDFEQNVCRLRQSKVTFPAVCKPILGHGSSAHQMTLVFNEKGLTECIFPCVVQSFVNHNAVMYKLFALGDWYFQVERPSIRNLSACDDIPPIHFDSGEVSKQNSSSQLTLQEESNKAQEVTQGPPSPTVLSRIVSEVHKVMGLGLFGVDVVVESSTGRLAVVDVNAFPGYDGVSDFAERLADFIRGAMDRNGLSEQTKGDQVLVTTTGSKGMDGANGTIPSSRLIKKTSVA